MSPLPSQPVARTVASLRALSPHQRSLRLAAFGAPLLTLLCVRLSGGPSPAWVWVVGVALAALAAARPDSHTGAALVGLLGWRWLVSVDRVSSPWVLAAALGVLTLHTCLAAASSAPPGVAFDRATRRRWWRRTAVVALGTAGLWALTVGLQGLGPSGNAVATVGALLALAAGVLTVRRLTVRSGAPPQ